jgi:hypothetical protein
MVAGVGRGVRRADNKTGDRANVRRVMGSDNVEVNESRQKGDAGSLAVKRARP